MIKLPAATSSSRYGVETEVAGNVGAEMGSRVNEVENDYSPGGAVSVVPAPALFLGRSKMNSIFIASWTADFNLVGETRQVECTVPYHIMDHAMRDGKLPARKMVQNTKEIACNGYVWSSRCFEVLNKQVKMFLCLQINS
jgi:hypothetical protein